MKSGMIAAAIVGMFLLICSAPLFSQDKEAPAKPGPMHMLLAKRAGEYTTLSKFWLKPGGEPIETKGTSKIKTILGGRFLLQENTGTMLGKPFKSFHLEGYNNVTKKFEATWAYSQATGMLSLVGTSKDDGKTIHYSGSFINDKGEKQSLHVKTRIVDDDSFVVELVDKKADGTKGPKLETTYTRKK